MYIYPFSKINKNDISLAGGKGASLGEMTAKKILVPPGFIIASTAFDEFLLETGLFQKIELIINKANYNDIHSVDKASSKIRSLIDQTKMPESLELSIKKAYNQLKSPLVAVRSSATAEDSPDASWAGELETYLNTNEEKLINNVKLCWSSLFTPRAIFYRHEKKLLKTKVSVAVVVQAMIQSEVSGIVFTVHPVSQDKRQLIIEAGYGLGEAIVSGSITPDSYVLDKKDLSLIDINIASQEKQMLRCSKKGVKWAPVLKSQQEKQKLSGQEIIELTKICLKIEKHYGFPCDIEWARFNNKFYITQSRPITTL